MDEDQRPGGLTALAVFNFIFTALNILGCFGLIFAPVFLDMVPPEQMTDEIRAQRELYQNMDSLTFVLMLAPAVISAVLLLLSGIGYLQRKSFLGRDLGNIYAVLAIITSITTPFITGAQTGMSVYIGMAIGMIYPVITLLLLNLKYKKYFTEEGSDSDIENLQV